MSVEIRPVRPEDLDVVADLTARAYLADGLLTTDDEYLDELRDAASRAEEATVLVAVEGGQVIGTITLAVAGSRYAEVAEPGEVEVRMLAVDPPARGRGVGEKLLRAALAHEASREADRLVLSTMEAMQAAHHVYRRLGLRRVPERDWPVEHKRMLVYVTTA